MMPEYGRVSHPARELTFRVTNPTDSMREGLRKRLGCSVTWFDCAIVNYEDPVAFHEWEATFDAEFEETFFDWAQDYDLEYWSVV